MTGTLISGEGVRTLIVFTRYRRATGKAYLGMTLALFGVSVLLYAPQADAIVFGAIGVPNLMLLVRASCTLGVIIGLAGLIELSGCTWLRVRYAVVIVVAGVVLLAGLVLGTMRQPGDPRLLAEAFWISGVVPGLVCVVYVVRIGEVSLRATGRVRIAGLLTATGCLTCVAGLIALAGTPGLASGGSCSALVFTGGGGVLVAAGSCYGEAVNLVMALRRRRENSRIRRLWRYIKPIRETMTHRPISGGISSRQIIDIYDALLLARQCSDGRVRARAALVAEAAGLGRPGRDEFVDAVELRSAVRNPGAARTTSGALDIRAETDPLDVDVEAQRAQVGRLARLVLRDGMVRRAA
ncbi:hypothetical protein [Amycolatopsis jejuensis]|uniref:hypothetical protein n=1 Tax=Amycolatopsis jejuensis TaxID=330084 RepID=UPI0005251C3D|nr:hypothetical protein [Amycolatopsis jejuensis]